MKHLLAVLALVLLVSVSGCIEPETSVRFSQLDGETAIAEEFSVSVDKIEPELQAVVTNQTKQNTTVRVSSSNEVIRHDGTYYGFERKQVGLTDVKRVEIATVEPSDEQATHDTKQLSEVDTALIRASLENPDNTRQFGAGKLYRGAEITESVLVEEETVRISYQNTTYSVTEVRGESLHHGLSRGMNPTLLPESSVRRHAGYSTRPENNIQVSSST